MKIGNALLWGSVALSFLIVLAIIAATAYEFFWLVTHPEVVGEFVGKFWAELKAGFDNANP